MTPQEIEILTALDAAIDGVREQLTLEAARVRARLLDSPERPSDWTPLPLSLYPSLPAGIQSSWIFVLRAHVTFPSERHPNSIQRMMSFEGSGNMQVWASDGWIDHRLRSDARAPLEQRWVSIPLYGWHRVLTATETWSVVSFHTVSADELIEETGDPSSGAQLGARAYVKS